VTLADDEKEVLHALPLRGATAFGGNLFRPIFVACSGDIYAMKFMVTLGASIPSTVNKLRDRQLPKGMIKRKREGRLLWGKNVLRKPEG
jgi:hypothetical protein